MDSYAVIETGGKQYIAKTGAVLDIELLDAKEGEKVTFSKVLAVSNGKELTIGAPQVKGASVSAEVLKQFRGKKVISFKKNAAKATTRKSDIGRNFSG